MTTDPADLLDQADMARLVAGRDGALDALMERHGGALYGFLRRFVGDDEAANDLSQETFLRVYQHRSDFKPAARFSAWLFTIGANLARNHLRARARRPEDSIDGPVEVGHRSLAESLPASDRGPDESALGAEQCAAIRRAVAELPDELREAVLLCELEDRSLAEAAGILATTVKAVESRLYRARQLLRPRLARWLAAI